MWAKKQKNHDGLSASKMSSFRVKFSLLIAEFSGDLCKQDCSLNGIAFIQIAPTFLMLSEFTPCPNPPQSTILRYQQRFLPIVKLMIRVVIDLLAEIIYIGNLAAVLTFECRKGKFIVIT